MERQWRELTGISAKDEILLGEYSCSHHGDLLVAQGRLFLSTNHFAFYAAFGAISMKKLVVAWSNVKAVEKTITNYAFSSGIKITQKDGDVRLFTQFVSRDKVYDVIVRLWSRASGVGKMESTQNMTVAFETSVETTENPQQQQQSSDVSSEEKEVTTTTTSSLPKPILMTEDSDGVVSAARPGTPVASSVGVANVVPSSSSRVATSSAALVAAFNGNDGRVQSPVVVTACEHWVEPTTEALDVVVLPFTLEEFVSRFIDDDGKFFNDFHSETGLGGPDNSWIKPYPKTQNACCYSRDFNFQQPITTTFPLAPPSTRVKQTHRWFYRSVDELCFGTSSMMPDIPYGSSFSIESKWKIKRRKDSVEVRVFVEGNFFKWLFGFRNTVEMLIKKDGNAYVLGLLQRMMKAGEQKASVFKEPAPLVGEFAKGKSVIRPAAIRETPPRLTPPPKKQKRDWSNSSRVLIAAIVILGLLMIYNVYLQRNFHLEMVRAGSGSGPMVNRALVQTIKAEVRDLKGRLEALEELLQKLLVE